MKIFRGNLDEATLLVEIDVTLTIVLVFFFSLLLLTLTIFQIFCSRNSVYQTLSLNTIFSTVVVLKYEVFSLMKNTHS